MTSAMKGSECGEAVDSEGVLTMSSRAEPNLLYPSRGQ
jgi:hypothetical protein